MVGTLVEGILNFVTFSLTAAQIILVINRKHLLPNNIHMNECAQHVTLESVS